MSISEVQEEKEEKEDQNVVYLKTHEGGKGGNWLLTLDDGVTFLCRKVGTRNGEEIFALNEFEKVCSKGVAVLLSTELQGQDLFDWVESSRFSKSFELVEILETSNEKEEH